MSLTPQQTTAIENALRQLDPDEATWPTGEQVEVIARALSTTTSTLHETVAEILTDREARTAAAHVRNPDHEQDVFDTYFGPMIDEIQVEHDGNECSCSNPQASAVTGHGHGCDLYFQR